MLGHMSDIDFIPVHTARQQGRFPNILFLVLKNILKIILTKILDKYVNMYYISIRQRGQPRRRGENLLWGPGIQTPSYILSPLDSGPHLTV